MASAASARGATRGADSGSAQSRRRRIDEDDEDDDVEVVDHGDEDEDEVEDDDDAGDEEQEEAGTGEEEEEEDDDEDEQSSVVEEERDDAVQDRRRHPSTTVRAHHEPEEEDAASGDASSPDGAEDDDEYQRERRGSFTDSAEEEEGDDSVHDEEDGQQQEEDAVPPAAAFSSFSSSSSSRAPPSAPSFPSASSSLNQQQTGTSGGLISQSAPASSPFIFGASSSSSSSSSSGAGAPSSAFSAAPPFNFSFSSSSLLSSSSASPFSSSASLFASSTSSSSSSSSSSSFPAFSAASSASTAAQLPPSTSAPASSSAPSSSSSAASSASAPAGAISVPVPCRSVTGVWGRGDELLLYADAAGNRPSAASRNNSASLPPHSTSLFRFQWPQVYGETGVLLHSWHAVFLTVQQQARLQAAHRRQQRNNRMLDANATQPAAAAAAAALSPIDWRTFLLSQSRCYRAELDACLYRAAQSLTATSTALELQRYAVSVADYHSHLLLLEKAASTWHLFELVFLDPHDNLTVQLVDWLQRSVPAPSTRGLQPDSDEWWSALLLLTVQGRLGTVLELLSDAAAAPSSPFSFLPASAMSRLLELLQAVPSLTAHAASVEQLLSVCRDYIAAVQSLAASVPAFRSHPYLPALLSVLAGDELALQAVCDDWMLLLVAQLIFLQPQTSKQDMPQLVQQCVQAMEDKRREEEQQQQQPQPAQAPQSAVLSQLQQHILCFRVHAAVLLADQMFEMPVLTAHLVDLLQLARVMPTLREATPAAARTAASGAAAAGEAQAAEAGRGSAVLEEPTPRDWYVWQYAQSLLSHDRLWTLAADYLYSLHPPPVRAAAAVSSTLSSSISPVHALCSLLLSQPCSSSSQLLQLLALASRHRLPAFVSERLCLRFANLMLRQGQPGSAVHWYQRSGEQGKQRLLQLARRLLDDLIAGRSKQRGGARRGMQDDGLDDNEEEQEADRAEPQQSMAALLDNIADGWLDEAEGSMELILLQQWREYLTLRQQRLRQRRQADGQLAAAAAGLPQRAAANVFQADKAAVFPSLFASPSPPSTSAAMQEDSVPASDTQYALSVSAVSLLTSLLTDPILTPAFPSPPVYTPQSLHLPLLRRLCSLLSEADQAGESAGGELSVAAVEALLNVLVRCEVSWSWQSWLKRERMQEEQVRALRAVLLRCLQQAIVTEESAKRLQARV